MTPTIPKTIALIGTFDTKGEEFSFLRDRIESAGLRTMMIDVGVLGSPPFAADISQAEVAAAANEDLAALQTERDRGRSVTAMALGATVIWRGFMRKGPSMEWLHWADPPARRLRPRPCARCLMASQS